jgi:hypothetical protein
MSAWRRATGCMPYGTTAAAPAVTHLHVCDAQGPTVEHCMVHRSDVKCKIDLEALNATHRH